MIRQITVDRNAVDRLPRRDMLPGRWSDLAGVVASAACAVHCAAMPIVLTHLPAWGPRWLADEAFHRWMAVACFLLATIAFLPGWRRHGSWVPVAFGSVGVALLTSSAFASSDPCCAKCQVDLTEISVELKNCTYSAQEFGKPAIMPWLTPLGGSLLVAGHLVNRRCSCGFCRDA